MGCFKGKEILHGTPRELWRQCSDLAGVSEAEFFEYFQGKAEGFAIHIDELTIFPHRVDLNLLGLSQPPQLYSYINSTLRSHILALANDPRKVRAFFYFSQIFKQILPEDTQRIKNLE
ncbi:MAG: hypothetical protein LUQ65_00980 [Candidatus Helarchaeota archaeon]|nr:hypothetical protein [Candidatus Helarchaeota archaeon]